MKKKLTLKCWHDKNCKIRPTIFKKTEKGGEYLGRRHQNYIPEVVQGLLLKQKHKCFRTSAKNKTAAIISLFI